MRTSRQNSFAASQLHRGLEGRRVPANLLFCPLLPTPILTVQFYNTQPSPPNLAQNNSVPCYSVESIMQKMDPSKDLEPEELLS